jgi:Bacterial Ig domain
MKGPFANARRPPMIGRLFLTGLLLAFALVASPMVTAATPLGANKFDLLLQYEGYSDYTDRSDAYRKVTRAMGRKAIFDAKDAGFAFLRVSVSGFGGSDPKSAQRDMLKLWQSDPATYWRRVDEMFDDIDKANLQIVPTLLWNYTQFPALTGETTSDLIRNSSSASRALATRYVQDFVTRYKGRKTILFLELTNEFNLHADMDVHRHCVEKNPDPARCVSIGNFSQDDLDSFAHDMVGLLHRLDPAHQVSSGYAVPPPWAYHMALRPEWNKPAGFVADSREDFDSNLAKLHRDFDIVSIHIYPVNPAVRFTRPQGSQADLIADAANLAHGLHKKLFVGEFGDTSGATPFMQSVKALLDANTADYAAVWAWEFYQTSTFETFNTQPTQFNVEPGLRDDVITLLHRPPATPESAPGPRVVLTWPLPCSHVSQPVQIAAVAADGDRPVSDVEFQVDGVSIGSVTTPPYHLTWDPAGKAAHTAHIKVIAHSQSKNTATDTADILLNGAGDACKVAVD